MTRPIGGCTLCGSHGHEREDCPWADDPEGLNTALRVQNTLQQLVHQNAIREVGRSDLPWMHQQRGFNQ
ncbi:MAG: hypothetical protein JSS14_21960 [Proteobacteria bacterium]|nr:hypothetical protein [Pseudomonadota bacterium]